MTDKTPLAPAALAEIEARANAATPGPWKPNKLPKDSFEKSTEIYTKSRKSTINEPVAIIPHDDVCEEGFLEVQANFAFIAHARTDIPALLKEVARLAAENERLRDAERIVSSLHEWSKR